MVWPFNSNIDTPVRDRLISIPASIKIYRDSRYRKENLYKPQPQLQPQPNSARPKRLYKLYCLYIYCPQNHITPKAKLLLLFQCLSLTGFTAVAARHPWPYFCVMGMSTNTSPQIIACVPKDQPLPTASPHLVWYNTTVKPKRTRVKLSTAEAAADCSGKQSSTYAVCDSVIFPSEN